MNELNILYEDNHLIVVVKESGILSQSDITGDKDLLTILKEYIKEKYQKPGNVYLGLVHRLDRPVRGIMVFAKTSKAAARLSEQIQKKQFEKKYYAIVHGYMEEKNATLVDRLEKDANKNVILNSPGGKEAILEYNVIEEKDNLSLVDITLKTGRYHQIRVQFASRCHPLYGDNLYGKKENYPIALCAYSLSFFHPITKEKLSFRISPKGSIWNNFASLQLDNNNHLKEQS